MRHPSFASATPSLMEPLRPSDASYLDWDAEKAHIFGNYRDEEDAVDFAHDGETKFSGVQEALLSATDRVDGNMDNEENSMIDGNV